jgi:antitoxin MazE6
MKTAISLPDELFQAVERLVRRSGRTRSELYADALRDYVARHNPDEITTTLDVVLAQAGETRDEERFVDAAARRTLASTDW